MTRVEYASNSMKRDYLEIYFEGPRFVKRLDSIRAQNKSADELMEITLKICEALAPRNYHHELIYHYLMTGEYRKDKAEKQQEVVVMDWGRRVAPLTEDTHKTFAAIVSEVVSLDAGVSLYLGEDITQSELIFFIKKNWEAIKESLDANYPGRMHTFRPVSRIEAYLTITEELNAVKGDSKKHAHKTADLAAHYHMNTPDVLATAKKYREIFY